MTVDESTIAFAHRLADASGAVIRPYFRRGIEVTDKKPVIDGRVVFDPVTEADRGAEQALRALIASERPDDGILGEEFGETPGKNELRWVLDPVDGTRSFITGQHAWGSLIALEESGRPVLGVLDQPVLGERYVGANGETRLHADGTTTLLKARRCIAIADAVLCATTPEVFHQPGEWEAWQRVERQVRLRRWGGDCYIFALMALGFVDLIVETYFKRWDVAALIPLVESAGGVITNWQGGSCAEGGQVLAAGDARVHAAALRLLNA
jgi:myo-inositol-1(or 4)-monophosphatase